MTAAGWTISIVVCLLVGALFIFLWKTVGRAMNWLDRPGNTFGDIFFSFILFFGPLIFFLVYVAPSVQTSNPEDYPVQEKKDSIAVAGSIFPLDGSPFIGVPPSVILKLGQQKDWPVEAILLQKTDSPVRMVGGKHVESFEELTKLQEQYGKKNNLFLILPKKQGYSVKYDGEKLFLIKTPHSKPTSSRSVPRGGFSFV